MDFCDVVSLPNLLVAWREFKRGKSKKSDVQAFTFHLEDNLFALYDALKNQQWVPDPYVAFRVADPKPRQIHKASVRDRVLYQAAFRQLYPIFDKSFIYDSYASRTGKGTLAGVFRLEEFARRASRNYTRQIFVLKCDIRKFFDGVDHQILLNLLRQKVIDANLLRLLAQIISSFEKTTGKGLPLGNVTSQLFANIYLNEFDQFLKRVLKAEYYVRYCDDFVIVDTKYEKLCSLIPRIERFLKERLQLYLHPYKISIRKLEQGVDFLGYVTLPGFRVLRTRTKRRMLTRCGLVFGNRNDEADEAYANRVLSSYKGLLSHSKGYRLWKSLEKLYQK